MTLALRYAARSHVGLVRSGNEDSGYAAPTMLVVADGMGGHAAGELASAAAVAAFAEIDAESSGSEGNVLSELASGVTRTTDTIRGVVDERPQLTGMGTTLTALAWREGLINVAHVGDSRAYVLRDGELQQMTHDHTYVQMLVDTGRITPEEALTHQRRNLILRAIDGLNPVEPDLQAREAHVGDRYLLCSDGLCGVVPEADLARLLATGDPTYAVTALVEAALEMGAPDNVTVIVAEVVDVDDESAGALTESEPVVVGAASEARTRQRLSTLDFPSDVEPGLGAERVLFDTEPVELPTPSTSRRGLRWALLGVAVLVVIGLIAAGFTGMVAWVNARYYVGTSNGTVVIFQGVNQTIAGRSLSSIIEEPVPPLRVDALPEADRSEVTQGGETYPSIEAARLKIDSLRAQVTACEVHWTPGCPGVAPAPTPAPQPTPTPQPTTTPLPTQTPLPTPSGTVR